VTLPGGIGNGGAVVRVGDHVLRPTSPATPAVHALLRHLRSHGFAGVPAVVGVDADGRERLRYIEGEVPVPPFPTWSITDRALVTMAKLLRRYHDAASSFTPPPGAVWNQELADPTPGDQPVLCHNDVCPENVVFSEAIAVALLDFDFAAPGRREWDVAAMARMCVPVETAEDAARTGRGTLDPVRRLRVVADAYGLDEPGRDGLLDALAVQFDQGGAFVRRRVEAGEPAFVAMWEAMGGQERYDRRQAWFDAERPQFLTALLEPR